MAESDLLRAVIEEAFSKVKHSPELRNDDCLPFHVILESFDSICDSISVDEATRQRAYQALMLMSSDSEMHLTWWEKVYGIEKYLSTMDSKSKMKLASKTKAVGSPALKVGTEDKRANVMRHPRTNAESNWEEATELSFLLNGRGDVKQLASDHSLKPVVSRFEDIKAAYEDVTAIKQINQEIPNEANHKDLSMNGDLQNHSDSESLANFMTNTAYSHGSRFSQSDIVGSSSTPIEHRLSVFAPNQYFHTPAAEKQHTTLNYQENGHSLPHFAQDGVNVTGRSLAIKLLQQRRRAAIMAQETESTTIHGVNHAPSSQATLSLPLKTTDIHQNSSDPWPRTRDGMIKDAHSAGVQKVPDNVASIQSFNVSSPHQLSPPTFVWNKSPGNTPKFSVKDIETESSEQGSITPGRQMSRNSRESKTLFQEDVDADWPISTVDPVGDFQFDDGDVGFQEANWAGDRTKQQYQASLVHSLITGLDEVGDGSISAIAVVRLFAMLQSWLRKQSRERASEITSNIDFEGSDGSDEDYALDKARLASPAASRRSNSKTRRKLRPKSAAIVLHFHLSTLPVIGIHHEVAFDRWLREKAKLVVRTQVMTELFHGWCAYAGVASHARMFHATKLLRKGIHALLEYRIRKSFKKRGSASSSPQYAQGARSVSMRAHALQGQSASSRFYSRSAQRSPSFFISSSPSSSPSFIQHSIASARRVGAGAAGPGQATAADEYLDAAESPNDNDLDSPTGLASFERRIKRKSFLLERSRSRMGSMSPTFSRSMSARQSFGAEEGCVMSRDEVLHLLQDQLSFFTKTAFRRFYHRTILLRNYSRLKQLRWQRSKARVWSTLQASLETKKATELAIEKKIQIGTEVIMRLRCKAALRKIMNYGHCCRIEDAITERFAENLRSRPQCLKVAYSLFCPAFMKAFFALKDLLLTDGCPLELKTRGDVHHVGACLHSAVLVWRRFVVRRRRQRITGIKSIRSFPEITMSLTSATSATSSRESRFSVEALNLSQSQSRTDANLDTARDDPITVAQHAQLSRHLWRWRGRALAARVYFSVADALRCQIPHAAKYTDPVSSSLQSSRQQAIRLRRLLSCVCSRHEATSASASAHHTAPHTKLFAFTRHPRGYIRAADVADLGAGVISKEGPPGIFTTTSRSPSVIMLAKYRPGRGRLPFLDLQLKKIIVSELYANPEVEKLARFEHFSMDALKSLPPGVSATKEYAALRRNMAWSGGGPLGPPSLGDSSNGSSSNLHHSNAYSGSPFFRCEDGTLLVSSPLIRCLFRRWTCWSHLKNQSRKAYSEVKSARHRHTLLQFLRGWHKAYESFHEIHRQSKRRALVTLIKFRKLRQRQRSHVDQTRLLYQQRSWSRVLDALTRSHDRRRRVVEKFYAMIRNHSKYALVADQVMPQRYSHVFVVGIGGGRSGQAGDGAAGHRNILSRLHIEESRLSRVRRSDSLYVGQESLSPPSLSMSIENIYKMIRQNRSNQSFRRNMAYAQQLVLSLYIASTMHRRGVSLQQLQGWRDWSKLHRNNRVIVAACDRRKQSRVIVWLRQHAKWRKAIRLIKRRRSAAIMLKWKIAFVATRDRRRKRRQVMKYMKVYCRLQSSCRHWLRTVSSALEISWRRWVRATQHAIAAEAKLVAVARINRMTDAFRCMRCSMRAEQLLRRKGFAAGFSALAKTRRVRLRLKGLAVYGHARLARALRTLASAAYTRQMRRQLFQQGSKQWRRARVLEGLTGLYAFTHSEPRPQLKLLQRRLQQEINHSDKASERAAALYQQISHRRPKPAKKASSATTTDSFRSWRATTDVAGSLLASGPDASDDGRSRKTIRQKHKEKIAANYSEIDIYSESRSPSRSPTRRLSSDKSSGNVGGPYKSRTMFWQHTRKSPAADAAQHVLAAAVSLMASRYLRVFLRAWTARHEQILAHKQLLLVENKQLAKLFSCFQALLLRFLQRSTRRHKARRYLLSKAWQNCMVPLMFFVRRKAGRRRLEALASRYHHEYLLRHAIWIWRVRKVVKVTCDYQVIRGERFEQNRNKSLAFMTWQVRSGGLPALMRQTSAVR